MPPDPTANPTPTTNPITTPTDDDQARWQSLQTVVSETSAGLQNLGNIGDAVGQTFNTLRDRLTSANINLENMGQLASDQSTKFGLITTSILGVKKAYTDFANVDNSKLVTFSGQISTLFDTIKNGAGTSAGIDAIKTVTENMKNMGASGEFVSYVVSKMKQGVVDVASAFFTSADNVLRLQNSMVQLTLQAGGSGALFDHLSKTLDGVGDNFENLNELTGLYQQKIMDTMQATHLNSDQIANYASIINKIPGGLKSIIDSTGVTTNTSNILTDSILYATGAGRDQKEVFEDMAKAMTEYSMSGDNALRFSARMTEVADVLGAQVNDVRTALNQSTEAFKMFVGVGTDPATGAIAMTQGMSKAMEEYVSQLTSVGVPINSAIDMFKNYTDQTNKMSIAQKSFLSAQTGGSGGLRGAFQIDAMIKAGDFEGLRKRTEDAIKRMTGPIVSFADAQKSEGAAQRYTRQIQILQQGPLGSQARTPQEAENLLEAMRTGTKVAVGATAGEDAKNAQRSLQKTVDRGVSWQERTHSVISSANDKLGALVMLASHSNLQTAQTALTAAGALTGGFNGRGSGINTENQEILGSQQRAAGTSPAGAMESVFKGIGDLAGNFPNSVKSSYNSLSEAMKGGNLSDIQKANDDMMKSVNDYKKAAQAMNQNQESVNTSGQQVRQNIPATKTTTSPTGQTNNHPMGAHNGQPVPVSLAPGSSISVNFTGSCPHCGTHIQNTQEGKVGSTTSPQSNVPR